MWEERELSWLPSALALLLLLVPFYFCLFLFLLFLFVDSFVALYNLVLVQLLRTPVSAAKIAENRFTVHRVFFLFSLCKDEATTGTLAHKHTRQLAPSNNSGCFLALFLIVCMNLKVFCWRLDDGDDLRWWPKRKRERERSMCK